jgi:hypothetical protein
MRDIFLRD